MCCIEDLEANLENNLYKSILREHIDRFKDEIGYDSLVADQDELNEMRKSLVSMYGEIDEFKANNPVKHKRKEDE